MTNTNTIITEHTGKMVLEFPLLNEELEVLENKIDNPLLFNISGLEGTTNIVKSAVADWKYVDNGFLTYEDIEDINNFVTELEDNFDDDELKNLEVLMDYGVISSISVNDDIDDLKSELENATILYADTSNFLRSEDQIVGETVAEEFGIIEEIPEHLQNYFDYEKYGRDLMYEGCVFDYSSGLIILP